MEFCVTIDRAAIAVQPFGIDIEPCVDGQTTTHGLWFDLTSLGGGIEFDQKATWRVPTNTCPQDFPNMRTP